MCFGWASFSHLSCTPHVSYPCSYLLFFPFFLLIHLSIHDKKEESILESIPKWIVIFMTHMHILKGRNSIGKMHIPKGRRHFFSGKPCFVCFTLCLFSCFSIWCFELCLVSLLCCSHIALCLCVGHAYILMLLCFIGCMFRWSFALLYDHCSHFHMTILCLIKFLICFATCLLDRMFTCYIILVLLLLHSSWGSNVFCASVSGYRYICSKFIITSRFRCEWVFPLFPNSHLSLESVLGCFVMK